MGEPIPPDWPDIIHDKWYCAYLDSYNLNECLGPLQGSVHCCMLGIHIINFINFDDECTAGFELCRFSGFTAQRLIKVKGPFDTREECLAECV